MAQHGLSRHPRESEAVLTELMMPHYANIMGNVFGGHILALVDRVAAVAAIRHAHRECVTVSVDKVDFREPIHVGELVTAKARVNFAGRTSMEVGVKVFVENYIADTAQHVASAGMAGRGVSCSPAAVTVDTATAWHPGGSVGVTVTCTTQLGDLGLPVVSGTRTISAHAAASIDLYRQLGP